MKYIYRTTSPVSQIRPVRDISIAARDGIFEP
jgi:hypothetical protein